MLVVVGSDSVSEEFWSTAEPVAKFLVVLLSCQFSPVTAYHPAAAADSRHQAGGVS